MIDAAVSLVPFTPQVFFASGVADMRKGLDGRAVLLQQIPARDPQPRAVRVSASVFN